MSNPDRARRQRLRQTTQVVVALLREHPDLPALTWTITPDCLRGHAEVCDVDPSLDRAVFTVWADALTPGAYPDPEPILDSCGLTHLRANRYVTGLPVILTATVHPF
jgi:hypothetical protein